MKCYVEKDELYPVYYLETNVSYTIAKKREIPDELYNKYKEISGNFYEVLEELTEYLRLTKDA